MAAVVQLYRSKKTRHNYDTHARTQHRWRVRSSNGEKLGHGGEGYANKADMIAAMRSVRDALNAFLENTEDMRAETIPPQ